MRRTAPAPDPLRVLLIDDDVDLSQVMVDALRSQGVEAFSLRPRPSAALGRLAASAAALAPDAILLDVVMPIDVGRLVEALKRREDLSQCLLLGCSGHALLAGAWSQKLDGFLHKPLGLKELGETIREAVALRRPVSPPSAAPRRKGARSRRRGASPPRRA